MYRSRISRFVIFTAIALSVIANLVLPAKTALAMTSKDAIVIIVCDCGWREFTVW